MTKFHQIGVNIGGFGGGAGPDPDRPSVTLDGRQLDGVRAIKVEAGVGQLTLVTITMEASVSGAALPAEPILDCKDFA